MLLCSKRTVDCADSFKLLRNWPVSNWHLAKAATTRAVNVSPILSFERVRKQGYIVAMPEAIADFAEFAQLFVAESVLLILETLQRLVALTVGGVSLYAYFGTSVALPLGPTLVRILRTMDFGTLVLSTALHAHAERGQWRQRSAKYLPHLCQPFRKLRCQTPSYRAKRNKTPKLVQLASATEKLH